MQKCILSLVLIVIVLLTSCNENQDMNFNKKYEETLNQLEKATADKDELQRDINNAEMKIKELEKQIVDLEEELEKQKVEKEDSTSDKILRIIDVDEKVLRYILDETSISSQNVSIIGCNIHDLVENYEEIQINGLGNGEYFKAEVIGSIYDFQLIKLEWDDTANKFVEVKVLHELDEVRNQTVYIETYLPCGMPSEKIKWRDSNGNIHEILLANDGYGFNGSIIWSE